MNIAVTIIIIIIILINMLNISQMVNFHAMYTSTANTDLYLTL